jgi:hypothetical protein
MLALACTQGNGGPPASGGAPGSGGAGAVAKAQTGGTGGLSPGSGGSPGTGGYSTAPRCQKPAEPPPFGATCFEPVTTDASVPSSCAPRWEGVIAAPSCHRTSDRFQYEGMIGAYLVRGFSGPVDSAFCFYDPTSKTLVAAYESTDHPRYCCDSYSARWLLRRLPEALPSDALCDQLDGGPVDANDAGD